MTRNITWFDSDTDEEMVQRLDRFASKIADPATSEVFHAAGSRILSLSEQVDRMRAGLLAALWHHQGGSSPIGQPIRRLLGITQHEHLTDEQVKEAKAFVHNDLPPVAPSIQVELVAWPFVLAHPAVVMAVEPEVKVSATTEPVHPGVPDEVLQQQLLLSNPATQVFFRAGLLACREHLANIFETQHPSMAAVLRSVWWPDLGKDYGAPRAQLQWEELTEGEFGTPDFRVIDPVSATLEALPIAHEFLSRRTGATTETES